AAPGVPCAGPKSRGGDHRIVSLVHLNCRGLSGVPVVGSFQRILNPHDTRPVEFSPEVRTRRPDAANIWAKHCANRHLIPALWHRRSWWWWREYRHIGKRARAGHRLNVTAVDG